MTDNQLLDVKDLHTYFHTYDGVVKAVDGVNFTIKKGQSLGLVGESGCGKSVTALSILRLIQQPPGRILKGQILLKKQDLLKLSNMQMQQIRGNRISMIFQEPMTSLDPLYRIGDQIAEPIRLHQKVSKREALNRAVELLEKVAIPNPQTAVKQYPYEMSGGMRQRVMIAIALSCNPEMLIADEPTTALDVTIQAQVLSLMNKLKKDFNASILIITHDLGVIAEMAQFVAVMYAGQIVEYANVVELFTDAKHPYTVALMDSIPKIDAPVPEDKMLKTISGVVPSLYNLPEGCHFRNRCPNAFDECAQKNPPLLELGSGHMVRCLLYG
ncbi:MAG: ABC transporter ATP-binding protein [Deltaproteobacteria bacterium]|nr:ABC transporter ATP-binding protein [Deltaproteobacteria bacterium]